MKKIFCIISAVFIGVVGSYLTVLAAVKKSSAEFASPYSINVYYNSTTTVNNGESYYEGDSGYTEVLNRLEKTLSSSLLTVMINSGNLITNAVYGGDNYTSYNTTMKGENLVVELIYKEEQNIVCYEDGNTRVISYMCLLLVMPCKSEFEEIVVYSALNNDSTLKEEEYTESTPFIIKGNPKSLIQYAETLSGSSS